MACASALTAASLLSACSPPASPGAAPAASAASAAGPAASGVSKVWSEGPPGPFTIEGVFPDAPKGTVVKVFKFDDKGAESGEPIATATVENGRYTLKGEIDVYQPVRLLLDESKYFYTDFFLEPGHFTVEAPRVAAWVTGGVVNDGINRGRSNPKAIEIHTKTRQYEGRETLSPSEQQAYEALYEQGRALAQSQIKALLADETVPLRVKLRALQFNPDPAAVSPEERVKWAERFERELGSHPLIDRMRQSALAMNERAAAQKSVVLGAPYKDVTVWDMAGKPQKLSDVVKANKLVLLDFWASWCAPCRAEFPHMRKAYEKYRAQGFEIFGIATDEAKADWEKASKEENIPWLNYGDTRGAKAESANAYGVEGLPSNYLIAQDGRIVATQVRGEALDKALAREFGATATKTP